MLPSGVPLPDVRRNTDNEPQGIGFKLEYYTYSNGKYDRWHSGHLDGTQAFFYNAGELPTSSGPSSNFSVIYLFNRNYDGADTYASYNESALQQNVIKSLRVQSDWGTDDLFGDW